MPILPTAMAIPNRSALSSTTQSACGTRTTLPTLFFRLICRISTQSQLHQVLGLSPVSRAQNSPQNRNADCIALAEDHSYSSKGVNRGETRTIPSIGRVLTAHRRGFLSRRVPLTQALGAASR